MLSIYTYIWIYFQVSNVFHEENYMSHAQRYNHMSFPWLVPPKVKRFFTNPDSIWSVMLVSNIYTHILLTHLCLDFLFNTKIVVVLQ